eukprot:4053573-Amphidinium_carterae.1
MQLRQPSHCNVQCLELELTFAAFMTCFWLRPKSQHTLSEFILVQNPQEGSRAAQSGTGNGAERSEAAYSAQQDDVDRIIWVDAVPLNAHRIPIHYRLA